VAVVLTLVTNMNKYT